MDAAHYLTILKDRRFRLTKIRTAVIEILAGAPEPLLVEDLQEQLAARGLRPNKTTVYRELDFLLEQGLVVEVEFGEGKKRYETFGEHHHHLICTECKKVTGVHVEEGELTRQEKEFASTHGFTVQRHMLEFFGTCKDCRPAAPSPEC